MRLRAHLVLLVLAVLIPVVALTAVTVLWVVRLERDAAQRATRETARSIAVRVDRELARAIAALQVLATSTHLDTLDLHAFRQAAGAAVTISGGWVFLSDRDGQQVMNEIAPPDAKLPRRVPAAMIGHRRAIETRQPWVSDLVIGAVSRRAVLNVDVPVVRDGRATHVLSMAMPTESLSRVLGEAEPPPEWIVAIADRQGITIARSHNPDRFVGQPIKEDIAAHMAETAEGVFANVTRDGVAAHNAFTRSAIAEWRIVVGMPVALVNAPLHRALWWLGVGGLGVTVLGVAGALAVGWRIVQPVNAMVEAAEALGAGQPIATPVDSHVAEITELARALDQASVLVREREGALRQAEHALRDADRMKDEFLAALSHELRTPMTAILGWARILESGQLDPAVVRKAVASIARNAEHQTRLIEDVLDVSRIITGNVALKREPCDAAALVRETVEGFQVAAQRKGVTLTVAVADGVGLLVADTARVRQILTNLLSNAVKFTPRNERIDVRVYERDDTLHIEVRDTGIGIDKTFLPHVFDRFRQADGTTTRAFGGLGLGLSIVRDLVALHRGWVIAHSDGEGQGATMTVSLPITRPDARALRTGDLVPVDGALGGRRILVVEDDPDASEFLGELLRARGAHVTETVSAAEALTALLGGAYDLVISDIGMAGRDGYQFIEDLRARGHAMPAVAVTAYAGPQDRERALAAGFDRHIAKPFQPREVVRAVSELCEARGAG